MMQDTRQRNWGRPPFDPRALDAVVLSHGHWDYSGYLPLLVKGGFEGPIYCTSGTAHLLGVRLRDAAQSDLLRWLRGFQHAPRQTYNGYGEASASRALASAIDEQLGWRVEVAKDGATVSLVAAP